MSDFKPRITPLFALLLALLPAFLQGNALAQDRPPFSQAQLDQMLAPIALYPDALLSQVLMASTYPVEVIEAARWSSARTGLAGDDAVRAAQDEDWDASVKSLVAFPQVLARMNENLGWTQSLGDAFLAQQPQLMDTVQYLRHQAQAAGNLGSDNRLRVYDDGQTLTLQPANPQLVYVPYYDPLLVFGDWRWQAYPPVSWQPWSGYYPQTGVSLVFFWGLPIRVSRGFFFGNVDWRVRHVTVVQVSNYYYYNTATVNPQAAASRTPVAWQHDPGHRQGSARPGTDSQRRLDPARAAWNRAGGKAAAEKPARSNAQSRPANSVRSEASDEGRLAPRPETHRETAGFVGGNQGRAEMRDKQPESRQETGARAEAPLPSTVPAQARAAQQLAARQEIRVDAPAPRIAPLSAISVRSPAALASPPAPAGDSNARHNPGARPELPRPRTNSRA
jgi:hypothetical protein